MDLGLLQPFDVNDRGEVVGRLYDDASEMPSAYPLGGFFFEYGAVPVGRAALWVRSATLGLGLGPGSTAFGINARGVVVGSLLRAPAPPFVGYCGYGQCFDGFVLERGAIRFLTGAGVASSAYGVSDRGDVAGMWSQATLGPSGWFIGAFEQGALWPRGDSTPLVLGVSGNSKMTYAIRLDGRGNLMLTGFQYFYDAYPRCFLMQQDKDAGVWTHTYIGDGGIYCLYASLNSKAEVVGAAEMPGAYPRETRAFAHENNTFVLLDGPSPSLARAISNQGTVVGRAGDHAAMWQAGVFTDLNDLLPAASGWTLTEAWAVSDRAGIAGIGLLDGKRRGFLLIPSRR